MTLLHLLLCAFLIICGLCVIFTSNSVQSMIALILMFCISGVILFIFNSEFLGVTFIIIYVGAIAVLFLFIIMMLNIKNTKNTIASLVSIKNKKIRFFIISLLVSFSFTTLFTGLPFFLKLLKDVLLYRYTMEKRRIPTEYGDVYYDTLEGEMDALEGNISMLGQSLFNYYSMSFLLAGLVLLIALIGAVCLTLHFNTNKKSQITSKQLSRSDAFLSYFKNKINKK